MSTDTRPDRFKAAAKRALRIRPVGATVRRIGALRGRRLVLVYHRIGGVRPLAESVVPSVPRDLFRRHLETLNRVGEITPLEALLRDGDTRTRPRFGLTFDDDFVSHFDHVLPTLQAVGAPATFFLSGRALHGLGSYWFEALERLIASRGLPDVGRMLGTHGEGVEELIAACENDRGLQEILEAEAGDVPAHLSRDQIAALAVAGMGVGFHTLHHPVLTRLDDDELRTALMLGREELEAVTGPARYFAYPHGKADRRVAAAVRDVGYEAAWTGLPHPMDARGERYLQGRWEPGRLDVDDFLVALAVRLNAGRARP